jgi:hypothetical protein
MNGTDHGIERGDLVVAVDAAGEELPRRALGGPIQGQNFEVVWVCREEEWHMALREGREPDGVPWPVEDVRPRVPSDTVP